jgi:hypothetical protein
MTNIYDIINKNILKGVSEMINEEYVNDSVYAEAHTESDFNTFMESCDAEINSMFAEYNMLHERVMLEAEIMDSVPEEMMIAYEAGQKNIFTHIGEFIIKIFNKIKEVIDKAIEKFKDLSFSTKSDMQKIDAFTKKHPKFADEIVCSFKKGELEVADMRSLKELEDTYAEIIKLSNKKDADPKSLKAKWEAAKEKFENADKSPIIKILGVTAGALVSIASIKKFYPDLLKSKNELQEQRKKSMELEASALESMKALQREFSDKKDAQGPKELVIRDDIGIAELTLQMSRYLNGKISDVTNSHTTIFTKIATGLAKMADKINPDSVNAAERKKTDLGAITSKKAEEKKAAEDAAELERERKKNDAIEIANAKKGRNS